MPQSLATFPVCTACGKLNSRAEIVECAKFTCKIARDASASCTPCLNLGKLEDQIAQAEDFLEHLKSHRKRLRADVNRVHDPFINQIPVEVASRIFTFCLEDAESLVGCVIEENHHIPFVLGAVCRRWRDVALSTPVLWTFLVLNLDGVPESPGYEEMLTTVLQRSGQCPLRFSLQHYPKDHPSPRTNLCPNVITILNQHSHRWRAIDIQIPLASISELRGNGSSTSILEQLHLYPDNCDNHGDWLNPRFCLQNALLSPQSVTISNMRYRSVSIDWSNVTEVAIGYLYVDECLRLLQDAPRLRDCALDNIQDGESSIPFPEKSIKHASLTTMEIDCTVHILPHLLLDRISFPSLTSLVFLSGYSLETLTSFIRRCPPPLTHLHVTAYYSVSDDNSELSGLLWLAPTITHLTLSYFRLTDAFFQLFHGPIHANPGPEEQQFLPCLTNFKFNFDNGVYEDIPFSWKRLSGSLLSRFENPEGLQCPLRMFNIVVAQDPSNDGYFLLEEAVAEFEELVEYGVDVQLRNYCDGRYEDMIAYSKVYHQRRKAEVGLT